MTTNTEYFYIGWKGYDYIDALPKKEFTKKDNPKFKHGFLGHNTKKDKIECKLSMRGTKAILDYLECPNDDIEKMKVIIHFTDTTRTKISRIDTQLKGKKLLKNDPAAYWTNSNTLAKEENENAAEGERHKQETEVIKRSSVLATARKKMDYYTCQACGYCQLVNGAYIADCHHLHPVSDGEKITDIDDLVTLCPNCHRIAHTSKPPLTVLKIKKIICALK